MGFLGKRIALLLASVTISLLIVEMLLRFTTTEAFMSKPFPPWQWHIHDPVLGMTLKPGYQNASGVQINQLGFRRPEIDPHKSAETIRVVCLGDSGTFGITRVAASGKPDLSTYPEALREIARSSRAKKVEVINGGVMGYTTFDGLRHFKYRILPLEPDVVTVRFGMNDHTWIRSGTRGLEPRTATLRWLLKRFHDWRLTRIFAAAYWSTMGLWPPRDDHQRAVSPKEFKENLERFVELSREHDFRLAFIDYPLRRLERGSSPEEVGTMTPVLLGGRSLTAVHRIHDQYQQIVRSVSEQQKVPLIETSLMLRQLDPPGFTDWDLVHPSASGKRKIAEITYARMKELGWL